PHHVQHDRAVLVRGRDVEEHQLVGALGVIRQGGLDGIAGVAQVEELDALDHAAFLDVEAGNDALGQHHAARIAASAAGRSVAARVPITTQATPASSTASTAATSRRPPPASTGTGRTASTILAMSAVCRGAPANAPSRSTTCRRSAPAAAQRSAIATGSSENT